MPNQNADVRYSSASIIIQKKAAKAVVLAQKMLSLELTIE
jgi:hypothetical protein